MNKTILFTLAATLALPCVSQAALFWTVGLNDDIWSVDGIGGGAAADFLQENGAINALPGASTSGTGAFTSDNDYYFAGVYSAALPGVTGLYGAYAPIGTVGSDETGWERAFAGGDVDQRIHFNIPNTFGPNDLFTISFDALNLDDTAGATRRFGAEIWFNGVMVRAEELIEPVDIGVVYTSAPMTFSSVGAAFGAGADNIVSLRGISYNGAGGGNWMGIDQVSMDVTPVPEPGGAVLLGGLAAAAGLMRRRRTVA